MDELTEYKKVCQKMDNDHELMKMELGKAFPFNDIVMIIRNWVEFFFVDFEKKMIPCGQIVNKMITCIEELASFSKSESISMDEKSRDELSEIARKAKEMDAKFKAYLYITLNTIRDNEYYAEIPLEKFHNPQSEDEIRLRGIYEMIFEIQNSVMGIYENYKNAYQKVKPYFISSEQPQ